MVSDPAVADVSADSTRGQLKYPLYAGLGAVAMVQATMTAGGVHVAVHDVTTQRVARVKDFPLLDVPLSGAWRMQLHRMSDAIEFWVTGDRAIAATRILFSSGGRIWQIDSDGTNPTVVAGGDGLALYPSWHPRATHIAYTAMTDDGTKIVIREIGGAARTLRATAGSMNSTPVFSPDGATILYSHGLENGTDLYAISAFAMEPPRRVTVSRGMDAMSPSFSPDGRRIVYVSNRPGHPELYLSDADGTNSELLTTFNFGDQSNRTDPSWSPDGRLIAFQAEKERRFQIHTINPRDRSIRQYTNEAVNEDPSWAPDSRHIVFTSNRSGSNQLWVLDTESNRVRQLTRAAGGAKAGAWSPMLSVH